MAAGVPVFLIGRSAERGKVVVDLLKPEYDVVHFCEDVSVAMEELSSVVQGTQVLPQAKLGSNMDRAREEYRMPKAVIFGAGFSEEDYENMRRAVSLPGGIVWVREGKLDPEVAKEEDSFGTTPSGQRLPKPRIIALNIRRDLRKVGL